MFLSWRCWVWTGKMSKLTQSMLVLVLFVRILAHVCSEQVGFLTQKDIYCKKNGEMSAADQCMSAGQPAAVKSLA